MMPHVDDGTLHALLDGALRAESPTRAAEVEAHVEGCADCRARLEAAAGLRDDAGRILDAIAIDEAPPVPDFAEVRARAARARDGEDGGAASPARPPHVEKGLSRRIRWTRGLAWAATLVVALGTGYLIRDLGGPAVIGSGDAARQSASPQAEPAERAMDEMAEEAGVATEGRGAPSDGGRSVAEPTAATEDESVGQAAAPPPPAPEPSPSPAPARAALDEAAAASDAAGQAAKARVEGEEEPASAFEAELRRRETVRPPAESVEAAGIASESAAGEPRALAPTALARRPPGGLPELQEGRWLAVTAAEAADALGGSLYVLPRATLVEVYRASDPTAPQAFTIQRLSSGITIRVVQSPVPADEEPLAGAGADRDAALSQPVEQEAARAGAAGAESSADTAVSAAPAANLPSASTVNVRRDGFLLEITGSLPAELLTILGESASPAR